MSNLQSPRLSNRIPYLDYLRILAAIGVIACHLWADLLEFLTPKNTILSLLKTQSSVCTGIRADGLFKCDLHNLILLSGKSLDNLLFDIANLIFGLGYQGVHIFLFLSGFGLTISSLNKLKKDNNIKWLTFLKKRFLRLYPSYWIILALYLIINYSLYKSFLGMIKTYLLGGIFLNTIPATWYIFIIMQLYLIFPFLFNLMNRLPLKNFIVITLMVKISASFIIILLSEFWFGKLIGFGDGALAPGNICLTRLFEFCFGMIVAKLYFEKNPSFVSFKWFTNKIILACAVISEILGLWLSSDKGNLVINGRILPLGLTVSDIFIGFGIVTIMINIISIFKYYLLKINQKFLSLVSNSTYEAYLFHGVLLSIFTGLFYPALLNNYKFFNVPGGLLYPILIYLIGLLIFTILNLSLGVYLERSNLLSYIDKKLNSLLGRLGV